MEGEQKDKQKHREISTGGGLREEGRTNRSTVVLQSPSVFETPLALSRTSLSSTTAAAARFSVIPAAVASKPPPPLTFLILKGLFAGFMVVSHGLDTRNLRSFGDPRDDDEKLYALFGREALEVVFGQLSLN
ncbi:hypothetical protein NE237_019591 [Protea cynaroides]|uniref:Uncharacterized protein n=1 Tax=Protea cynaroides TaxID=273540 RepID=A0A9Q0H6U5_9MAGN|nr:hypothetical protein NE237_019591 [Protea cynaroides]